jgi:hypothetical protein
LPGSDLPSAKILSDDGLFGDACVLLMMPVADSNAREAFSGEQQ